ncbi:MAG: transcriptional repressor [Chloroflexi bacterium]|nr:transcriptional repressor [Chloroflexota bacterium]
MTIVPVKPNEWLRALKDRGYRLTPTKRRLLATLSHATFPLTAEKAWDYVRSERPQTGRATIYRLFDALEELGFLRRVHGLNHCNQYVLAQDSERPLVVCVSCGKAEFLADDALQPQLEALTQQSGYRLHAAHIQLLGMCSVCQSSF